MSEGIITIRKGRDKPIRNQHPWIFSGAIAKAENASDGDIVTVVDHAGNFLARGYWNHKSQIQVRILTWQDEPIDEAWWRKMLKRAIDARQPLFRYSSTAAYRVFNAENDFIPGLIVDRYAGHLVIQALTLFIDHHKLFIAETLVSIFAALGNPVQGVYERSDIDVRGKEGLKEQTGLLWGEQPPQNIETTEGNIHLKTNIYTGHKTGNYLDQRDNRLELGRLCNSYNQYNADFRLLNLFSYTGGFGVHGTNVAQSRILEYATSSDWSTLTARIVNVDASLDALELAKKNFELNATFKVIPIDYIQADVFEYLRGCVERGEQYDIVILDPPKFAHNKQQVEKAARGYKDINLNAFKIIKPGGYLMTFSCSGAVSRDLFQKIVFGALADSGRQAQIIKHLSASDDHPVALTFPEGEYLKGLLLRVY